MHLVSLVLNYELVEYLAGEYLRLPSPLIVDNASVERLVAHRVIEDDCQLLHPLIQILPIGLNASYLRR